MSAPKAAPAYYPRPSHAIRMATDAMAPRYEAGCWLLVKAAAKPAVGDDYIFAKGDNATKVATLRAVTRGEWKANRCNRKGSLSLARAEWRPLWRIIGTAHKDYTEAQMRGGA